MKTSEKVAELESELESVKHELSKHQNKGENLIIILGDTVIMARKGYVSTGSSVHMHGRTDTTTIRTADGVTVRIDEQKPPNAPYFR